MKRASDASWAKVLQVGLLIFACVVGTDFLLTPPNHSLYLTALELPLVPLGVAFLTLGIAGIIGLWWRELCRGYRLSPGAPWLCRVVLENPGWAIFGANVGLFGIYLGLFAAAVTEQVVDGRLYGATFPAGMLLLAAAHWWHAQNSRDGS